MLKQCPDVSGLLSFHQWNGRWSQCASFYSKVATCGARAEINLKSTLMPRRCSVPHLKIRPPSALRCSLMLVRPDRTTDSIMSSVV